MNRNPMTLSATGTSRTGLGPEERVPASCPLTSANRNGTGLFGESLTSSFFECWWYTRHAAPDQAK